MDAFKTLQENIDWAKSCLEKAVGAFDHFMDNNAFAFVADRERQTGDLLIKLKMTASIPVMSGRRSSSRLFLLMIESGAVMSSACLVRG